MPSDEATKKILSSLSTKLMELHKELLAFQTRGVEQQDQRRYGPYEILQMSLNDDRFEWMRILSKLIIRVDIMISEDKDREAMDAKAILNETYKLFSGGYSDFDDHYRMALECEPPLISRQAEVMKVLADLASALKKGLA